MWWRTRDARLSASSFSYKIECYVSVGRVDHVLQLTKSSDSRTPCPVLS